MHKRALAQKPREDPQKQTVGVFSKRASAKAFAGYWLLSEKRPCHYGRFGEYWCTLFFFQTNLNFWYQQLQNLNKGTLDISTFKMDT